MTRKHRTTPSERSYAAAEDRFTSLGGRPSSARPELAMAEFGIGYDGLQYEYHGYRYDRLEEAVAYAGLVRSRPTQLDAGGPFRQIRTLAVPTDAQRALMATLGIEFADGAFRFAGFRYESLADAVNYAKLTRSFQTL
ncbi:hypothetical protein HLB44_24585 [Aquincola sp. S2]|uniref:KTSC domain-containing protein n=1 Tax=Pseudaquabacterium terrae TaxID=2732868 RepID=A0ABX2ENC0_9BURK|nr:hypothetical protein [Aquabacterium terrae]NRF70189.1 hypothetical protein [Aquabacterium terrae]